MIFEDSYRLLFIIYRLFGIAPFSHFFNLNKTTQNSKQKIRQIISLIVEHFWIVCILAYEFYILMLHLWKNYQIVILYMNLYTVSFSLGDISYYILLITVTIESYCQRNVQVQILRN